MINVQGIEYKFYIEQLFVKQFEGFPNSVARVRWVCVMQRNGVKLVTGGQTDLDAPSGTGFIDIGALEAQQVVDWVIEKNGGESWLSGYLAAHDSALTEQEQFAGLEAWRIPLINPLKFDPLNV